MRICSLIPGATEVIAALGLEHQLVGISHECDFPPSIRQVPVMIEPLVEADAPQGEEHAPMVDADARPGEGNASPVVAYASACICICFHRSAQPNWPVSSSG